MELEPITESKLVVVEGNDDKNLLGALIEDLGLRGVQIIRVEGKGEMQDKIMAVRKTTDFENKVTSLGVVRDADEDAEGTFQSVCDALRKAGLSVPSEPLTVASGTPRVIVLIWPCDRKEGTLEDVCLQSVAELSEIACVSEYFECLQKKGIVLPGNLSKAKVHAFLASRPEACPSLGVGALKRYWQFESKAFDGVRNFLAQL